LERDKSLLMGTKMGTEIHSRTIRLDQEFYRRLKSKLAADGTTFQSKVQALLEEYLEGPAAEREEVQRQVAAARAAMRRYSCNARTRALKEPVWVNLDAVLILHEENLLEFGGASGIRHQGAIKSALARPAKSVRVRAAGSV
jgi:hypothetical protein